ncbi:unnamed protein product, partial [Iphiclides podalirius]
MFLTQCDILRDNEAQASCSTVDDIPNEVPSGAALVTATMTEEAAPRKVKRRTKRSSSTQKDSGQKR